jgi:hypothetical protein
MASAPFNRHHCRYDRAVHPLNEAQNSVQKSEATTLFNSWQLILVVLGFEKWLVWTSCLAEAPLPGHKVAIGNFNGPNNRFSYLAAPNIGLLPGLKRERVSPRAVDFVLVALLLLGVRV